MSSFNFFVLSIQSDITRQSIQSVGSGVGADDVNLVDETSEITKQNKIFDIHLIYYFFD